MVAAAKESGKVLTIGYQHRHTAPRAQYLKEAMRQLGSWATFTTPRPIGHPAARRPPPGACSSTKYEQGGGPLIDIGTHALDLTLWLMDNYKPRMVVGNSL